VGLSSWMEERLPLASMRELAAHKTVPLHRYSLFYFLGGMALFFFLVQVGTGILLMLYYRPSAEEAFESVEFLMTTVSFGWLIRSVHSWSANLMIFFAFVHLVTVYFMKAYRAPREITWITGCLLFFVLLAFGFSGYLLPWNQLAFFATKVGTEIAGLVPWVGEWLVRFLRGGDHVTGGTLSRFYGWHVAILPAVATVLLGIHLVQVQRQGMSVPPELEARRDAVRTMRFVPDFLLRDLFGWVLALGVLAALAALFPWELGEKADPFAPAYPDIRPEWYFVFMFETLKLVPGGGVAGLEYETLPILGFGLAALLLVLVPFLDRKPSARAGSGFTLIGVLALVYVVGMTARGYRSWVPAYGFVLAGQHPPGAAEAGLHLVRDQQHAALRTDLPGRLQVAGGGDHDSRLALDRLHQERADVVVLERALQRGHVVVGDLDQPRGVGTEAGPAVGIGAGRDDGDGAAVEVALAHHDLRLAVRDALLLVGPLAGQLEGGLDGLGTAVHGQDHVEAEQPGHVPLVLAEGVAVERAARQGQAPRLLGEGGDDLRVAVPLVDGGVGREKVVVAAALRVPDEHALSPGEDDRKGVIVVGAVLRLQRHGLLRRQARRGL